MLSFMFSKEALHPTEPKEGEIYKILYLHGQRFELRYGYYEDYEREALCAEPMPIYPDFRRTPCFTAEGAPFATKMQDICSHYAGRISDDSACADCRHYCHLEDMIGICSCPENQRREDGA